MMVLLNVPPRLSMTVLFLPNALPVFRFYGYHFLKFANCELVIQYPLCLVDNFQEFLSTISEGAESGIRVTLVRAAFRLRLPVLGLPTVTWRTGITNSWLFSP